MLYKMEEQTIIEQHIEQLNKVEQSDPVVKRPSGRPRIEQQPKEHNKLGRPRIERPPKIPQKRSRRLLIKTEEPKEKRPKGRPRLRPVGRIGRPKDPAYYKTYYPNITKPTINSKQLESINKLLKEYMLYA